MSQITTGGSTPRTISKTYVSSAQTAAGNSGALWTPAAGKKIRLMGIIISTPAGQVTAGVETFEVTESAGTVIARIAQYIPTAALIASQPVVNILLGPNGYVTAVNGTINVEIQPNALTAGGAYFTFFGDEE
jgi:hypothetical protein